MSVRIPQRRAFNVLQAAIALAVAGCREKTAPPPPPLPVPVPTTTTSSMVRIAPTERRPGQRCTGAIVAGLHPAKAVDYLELRLDYYPQGAHEVVTAGQTGTPCGAAKDPDTCKASLARAMVQPSGGEYLVYTRGDEVGTVTGRAVAAFLAPIDSPEEAAATLVYALADGTSTAAVLPSCDAPAFRQVKAGYETTHVITRFCNEMVETTYVVTSAGTFDGEVTKSTPPLPNCHPPGVGRMPEGFGLVPRTDQASIGGFFAECTELEAASITSFRRLEADLRGLGAPRSLRRRALRSARDEVRHARAMRSLARRFGARPRRVVVRPTASRLPVDVALENIVEGCVFETWAALVATWQAACTTDEDVRETMTTIARDETRHAALAWDVAAWLSTRLDASAQARVDRALLAAQERLRGELASEPSAELRAIAGLPNAAEARALYASFFATPRVVPLATRG